MWIMKYCLFQTTLSFVAGPGQPFEMGFSGEPEGICQARSLMDFTIGGRGFPTEADYGKWQHDYSID
ncbi:hypothetical protein OK016_16515 [Vibrio chagasii]|nr:hypothetical protein [Vibrio chagasii]